MTRRITFIPRALEHLNEWLHADKKGFAKVLRLTEECRRTPFVGIGKPEPVKGHKSRWCREIDDVHSVIYDVNDDETIILSLRGHYGEKLEA